MHFNSGEQRASGQLICHPNAIVGGPFSEQYRIIHRSLKLAGDAVVGLRDYAPRSLQHIAVDRLLEVVERVGQVVRVAVKVQLPIANAARKRKQQRNTTARGLGLAGQQVWIKPEKLPGAVLVGNLPLITVKAQAREQADPGSGRMRQRDRFERHKNWLREGVNRLSENH